MEQQKVHQVEIIRVEGDNAFLKADLLAVEEPLEIRLGYGAEQFREQKSLSVTMRTPGNDFELAVGFLFTEGIINNFDQVIAIKYCESVKDEEKNNVVRVELSPEVEMNWSQLQRHFYTSSSCGVCGKSSISSVMVGCNYIDDDTKIVSELIYKLPQKLQVLQPVFTYTGGLHAAALLDAKGNEIFVREDVGRHNALDKVIGAALIAKDTASKIVVVSGRLSFELIQKASIAKIPIVVAVGAPSSLAVKLAMETGITLIGFTKESRFNIYTGKERVNYEIENKR